MKLTKLFAIAFCIAFSSQSYSGGFAISGDAYVLVGNMLPASQFTLFKNVEFQFHNSNNFPVTIKVRKKRVLIPRNLAGLNPPLIPSHIETSMGIGTPVTIPANSTLVEIFTAGAPPQPFPGTGLCTSDMYTLLRDIPNITLANSQCSSETLLLNVSWQDTIVTNVSGSLKSVTPILGSVRHQIGQSDNSIGDDFDIRNQGTPPVPPSPSG